MKDFLILGEKVTVDNGSAVAFAVGSFYPVSEFPGPTRSDLELAFSQYEITFNADIDLLSFIAILNLLSAKGSNAGCVDVCLSMRDNIREVFLHQEGDIVELVSMLLAISPEEERKKILVPYSTDALFREEAGRAQLCRLSDSSEHLCLLVENDSIIGGDAFGILDEYFYMYWVGDSMPMLLTSQLGHAEYFDWPIRTELELNGLISKIDNA